MLDPSLRMRIKLEYPPLGAYMGSGPPEKHKNIGFFSNTGPDPLKNHKATKPAFNVGPSSARQRNAIKWRFTGGPMIASL